MNAEQSKRLEGVQGAMDKACPGWTSVFGTVKESGNSKEKGGKPALADMPPDVLPDVRSISAPVPANAPKDGGRPGR